MWDGVREEYSGEECGDVVIPIHESLLGFENRNGRVENRNS
jgi:hypothetical protein